jgi:WD40 repeat protein
MIEWNPEGSMIATGSVDKTVRLWSVDGELQHILEHKGALASLKWNPQQENLLATGSYDRTAQLWRRDESVALLKGHRDRVFGLGWSSDGKSLATSSGFKDGEIIVWDDSGEKVTSFENHTSSVYQVSWNPTSDLLASASFDGTARLWNIDGELAVLRHPGPVFAAKWNNQGNLLATAGMGIVAIWDATKFF